MIGGRPIKQQIAQFMVTWVGADNRERPLGRSVKNNKVYGGDTALPIFISFMERMDQGRPSLRIDEKEPKDEVRHLSIDRESGKLALQGGQRIPHRRGYEPSVFADAPGSSHNILEVETEF